jgi:hypothetical protein
MGLTVSVNGIAAVVHEGLGSNGTFIATGVPIHASVPGALTTLTATARDALGNEASTSIEVHFDAPPAGSPTLAAISRDGQDARIGTELTRRSRSESCGGTVSPSPASSSPSR